MHKGMLSAFGVIGLLTGVVAGSLAIGLRGIAYPSPNLFRGLGQAGIGLLIAYSFSLAAAERFLGDRNSEESHTNWLGVVVGLGLCALIGSGLAFGLAEHRAAGHANALDWIGLWWSVGSIGMIGLLVAVQPVTTYEWRRLPARRRWRVERLRSEGSRSRGPAA
jgi:hypothetical protein